VLYARSFSSSQSSSVALLRMRSPARGGSDNSLRHAAKDFVICVVDQIMVGVVQGRKQGRACLICWWIRSVMSEKKPTEAVVYVVCILLAKGKESQKPLIQRGNTMLRYDRDVKKED